MTWRQLQHGGHHVCQLRPRAPTMSGGYSRVRTGYAACVGACVTFGLPSGTPKAGYPNPKARVRVPECTRTFGYPNLRSEPYNGAFLTAPPKRQPSPCMALARAHPVYLQTQHPSSRGEEACDRMLTRISEPNMMARIKRNAELGSPQNGLSAAFLLIQSTNAAFQEQAVCPGRGTGDRRRRGSVGLPLYTRSVHGLWVSDHFTQSDQPRIVSDTGVAMLVYCAL